MSEPEDEVQKEEVNIIASGYEWICPNCDFYNEIMEITEIVCCEGCHYKYKSGEAQHAHK